MLTHISSNHPLAKSLMLYRVTGGWSWSQLALAESRGTPWRGCHHSPPHLRPCMSFDFPCLPDPVRLVIRFLLTTVFVTKINQTLIKKSVVLGPWVEIILSHIFMLKKVTENLISIQDDSWTSSKCKSKWKVWMFQCDVIWTFVGKLSCTLLNYMLTVQGGVGLMKCSDGINWAPL